MTDPISTSETPKQPAPPPSDSEPELQKINVADFNRAMQSANSLQGLNYASMTAEQRDYAEQALAYFGYLDGNHEGETPEEHAARVDAALQAFVSEWHAENRSPAQQFLLLLSSFIDANGGFDRGSFEPGQAPANVDIPRYSYPTPAGPSPGRQPPPDLRQGTPTQPRPLRDNERIDWSDIVSPAELTAVAAATGMTEAALKVGLQRAARELETVHPLMRGAVARGIHDLYVEKHMPVTIAEGYRDPSKQAALVASGASHAGPGLSFHNHSLAVDVVPVDRNGEPTWDGPRSQWDTIRSVLDKKYGMHSIGDWDQPHHQIFPNIRNVLRLPIGPDGQRDLSSVMGLIPPRMLAAGNEWEAAFAARHGRSSQVAGTGEDRDHHDHGDHHPRAARVAADTQPHPRLPVADAHPVDLGQMAHNALHDAQKLADAALSRLSGLFGRA